MNLPEAFQQELRAHPLPPGPVLAAVSGGLDSLVLLDLLVSTADDHGHAVLVGHVDHAIHPASAQAAELVVRAGERYGVPVETVRLGLGAGASETAARQARWAALRELQHRVGAGCIATAHHRDDLVETVLLRVLAGSGPAGLVGIPRFMAGIAHPLLSIPQAMLRDYGRSVGISSWWEDPANRDPRHDRGWLRQEVLPVLRDRKSDLDRQIARVALQAEVNREAWDGVLEVLPGLDLRRESGAISVAAASLRGYHSAVAGCAVMALGRRLGKVLGPAASDRVMRLIRSGRSGARVDLGGAWSAELVFDRLWLLPPGGLPHAAPARRVEEGKWVWGSFRVSVRTERAPDGEPERVSWRAWLASGAYRCRGWQAGDRLTPVGGAGSRPVVRCLQEARVPASWRSGWLVVTDEAGRPVWIPGVCRGTEYVPPPGTEALRIDVGFS